MKALVVFAHPNPKSFNRAILDTIVNDLQSKNVELRVKDLYNRTFNPVLSGKDFEQIFSGKTPEDIAAEQADVTWANTLIFVYPIWWWGPPAILKGWFERVFSNGFAYKYTPEGPKGLLTNKKALVITTSGSTEAQWSQNDIGVAVNKLSIEGIYSFVGIEKTIYKNFYAVPAVPDETRTEMLRSVMDLLDTVRE